MSSAEGKGNDIVVVGSLFMDLISYTERIPVPGETIVGTDFQTGYGGKGANQCVAASRLGTKCAFVGKLGNDVYGKQYYDNMVKEGVNVNYIKIEDKVPTGVASIIVGAADGQNIIVCVFGATGLVTPAFVEEAEPLIANSKVVVVQLEIAVESSFRALQLAKKHSVKSIFNVAPGVKDLPREMLSITDILCLNETEAEIVTGLSNIHDRESAESAIEKLRNEFQCQNSIIITLGSEGVLLWDSQTNRYHFVVAPKVQAVDCTGAGDCFVGTLAHCLAAATGDSDDHLINAVKQAVTNASDSVLRKGTQSSFPHKLIPSTQ
ncbi:Ribokinase [Orchesella cincta]|uniref:Ribokinase n=1 Tax=Orchesella cincta TaxID=48709 RepID=A0A1D2N9A0_ORCCI|nr:Ribokinase [Orchesella cincta]